MKSKLLFLILCFYPFLSYAQSLYPEDRRWLLNVAEGANFDLSGSSSNPNSELLGSRPSAVMMAKYRLTYLFSKKVGWYADTQFNVYSDRQSSYHNNLMPDNIIMVLLESITEVFPEVFLSFHPSLGTGLVYRIEHGRWKIHPEVGVGYGIYLHSREKSKTTMYDNVEHGLTYKQEASSWYMDVGVSANYFITRRCFFVLNAGFKQPLQKSHAELIHTEDGVEVDRLYYETSRVGRSLNVGLGFGFTLGKNHK
jgi:hypothetical protein